MNFLNIFKNKKWDRVSRAQYVNHGGDTIETETSYETPDETESFEYHCTASGDRTEEKFEFQVLNDIIDFSQDIYKEFYRKTVSQKNGEVTGAEIASHSKYGKNVVISSCVNPKTDNDKRDSIYLPDSCKRLEYGLLRYSRFKKEVDDYLKRLKGQGKEITLEQLLEIGRMNESERKEKGFLGEVIKYADMAVFISDNKNNKLRNFTGTYIGNIVERIAQNGDIQEHVACVVTEQDDHRLYTIVPLRKDTLNPSINSISDPKNTDFLNELETFHFIPAFETKIKDGKETVVSYYGQNVMGECPEFNKFEKVFIKPFESVQPITIEQFVHQREEISCKKFLEGFKELDLYTVDRFKNSQTKRYRDLDGEREIEYTSKNDIENGQSEEYDFSRVENHKEQRLRVFKKSGITFRQSLPRI